MKLSTTDKYALAVHGVPLCAVCNRPVERMEWQYEYDTLQRRFRVYCHGQTEVATLTDMDIWNADSIRMGQAFIDQLPQPQLENK